jgi:hypothetical protein
MTVVPSLYGKQNFIKVLQNLLQDLFCETKAPSLMGQCHGRHLKTHSRVYYKDIRFGICGGQSGSETHLSPMI